MKEIKFKCWFKSSKIMSREFSIENIKNSEVDLLDGATYLQYTGLKDKNGKEIYEGDIVDTNSIKGNIIFTDGSYCIKYPYATNKLMPIGFLLAERDIEVIGNIYENPELLKEAK